MQRQSSQGRASITRWVLAVSLAGFGLNGCTLYDLKTDNKLSMLAALVGVSLGSGATDTGDCVCVSESGTFDSYTIALTNSPSSAVTVTITPDTVQKVYVNDSLDPVTLIFTPQNYSQPQTLTVRTADDLIAEGTHQGLITNVATAGDPDFVGQNLGSVTVTIADDDTAQVEITESSGSTTLNEGAGTDTYTIRLTSEPIANVTVALSSPGGQLAADKSSVTFTPSNWNTSQTITVTATDDPVAEGVHNGTIAHSVSSSDPTYAALSPRTITGFITDNDSASLQILPSGGSTDVTEGAGNDTYTVQLTSQPLANVTVNIGTDGQVTDDKGGSLLFTPTNWSSPQTVTITAVDDVIDESAIHVSTVSHGAVSADANFNGQTSNMSVNVTDNDTAAVSVVQSAGSTAVNETGPTTDSYTVRLMTQPTAPVTVNVNFNPSQVTVNGSSTSPVALTFNATCPGANCWSTTQTVTVQAVDDAIDETASHNTTITHNATSADGFYNGIAIGSVVTAITDNDTAAVVVTESGSTDVNETGATTDTYTVRLATQPTATVTVNINFDPSQVTINGSSSSPAALTFDATCPGANCYSTAKTVTVRAVDDIVDESAIHNTTITHSATSGDGFYNGIGINSVVTSITDNDTAAVVVTESGSTAVNETGPTSDSYTVRLATQPTASVTINVNFNPAQVRVNGSGTSPVALTFDATCPGANCWSTNKTVTVQAVDDSVDETAVHSSTITHSATSSDTFYNGIGITSVTANITDNDTSAVVITESGSTNVTEGGTTDSYTVALATQPANTVTVNVNFSATDIRVNGSSSTQVLTFDATCPGANCWSTPKTVNVQAFDDSIDETSPENVTITHSSTSADPLYNGLGISSVNVAVTDNDTAGYIVSSISNYTSETGVQATFTIRLQTQPTGTVTIGLSSNDVSEGTVSPSSVTFDATCPGSNCWSTNKTVTVTGVNDLAIDGNVTYSIITATPTGTDGSGYLSLNPPDVTVINWDNEVRHIFRTQNKFNGNLGGVAGADATCNSQAAANGYPGSWKAMIGDGSGNTRRACSSANCTNAGENINWVLRPNEPYYRAEDNVYIGTTNSAGIFIFNLSAPVTSDPGTAWPNHHHWTGMYKTWQNGEYSCTGWTVSGGDNGIFGRNYEVTNEMITPGGPGVYTWVGCGATMRLICAEQ